VRNTHHQFSSDGAQIRPPGRFACQCGIFPRGDFPLTQSEPFLVKPRGHKSARLECTKANV